MSKMKRIELQIEVKSVDDLKMVDLERMYKQVVDVPAQSEAEQITTIRVILTNQDKQQGLII